MQKNKNQKKLQETLSAIDGVLAALDSYPSLEDAVLSVAQDMANKYLGKYFPTQIDFTKEVLEHLVGTDTLIEIISKFLTTQLPAVEIALKAVLLENMQNLGTGCMLDPFIYEKNILEGVTFELSQIDLTDKLTVSPLDEKIGQYYYFGIEGCESAYDVLQSAISPDTTVDSDGKVSGSSYLNRVVTNSVGHYFGERKRDFDCLLWYMKNKSAYRQVWGKQTTASENIFYDGRDGEITSDGEKISYSYGDKTEKQVSRKNYYYGETYIYYYDDNGWTEVKKPSTNYSSVDNLSDSGVEEGDFVKIDGSIYKVESITDNGKYVLTEATDITNGLNTYVYIDEDGTPLFGTSQSSETDTSSFEVDLDGSTKYTKDFGILTLEYSSRTGNVKQSDGNPLQQQTPYSDVLHVFFGNVKEFHDNDTQALMRNIETAADYNKYGKSAVSMMKELIELNNKVLKNKLKEWTKSGKGTRGDLITLYSGSSSTTYYESDFFSDAHKQYYFLLYGDDSITDGDSPLLSRRISGNLYNNIDDIESKIESIYECIYDVVSDYGKHKIYEDENTYDYAYYTDFVSKLTDILGRYTLQAYTERMSNIVMEDESMLYLSANNMLYPDAIQNYYYKRTLFEFNVDYVNSLQLFDSKVLAAQLISSLFGGATISTMAGVTLSWKTQLIQDTVRDMIQKTIAADDVTVSDCFYTFSNDAYNGMLRATELRQAGLYSNYGEENGNNAIGLISLLSGLNDIDSSTDQAGQTSIIKGAILDVSAEVSKDTYSTSSGLSVNSNLGIQVSFIQTLIYNLCTQLVMAMLSPKVYLLILINLKMFGIDTNFDIKSFIERFSNLIRSIVQSIVTQFVQYLIDEILAVIEELIEKLMAKIAYEQAEMYMRLLKQILKHLKSLLSKGGYSSLGWTQDTIMAADIEDADSETEEPIDEC